MRISRSSLVAACVSAALALAAPVRAQALVKVFDPRASYGSPRLSRADSVLLDRVVRPAARRRWGEGPEAERECVDEFQMLDVTAGAFTRAGARQRAFLYEYCRLGRLRALGGIAVVEGGRVVANVMSEGKNNGIYRLPDIDRNGRDEMVVVARSQGQGRTEQGAWLREMEPRGNTVRDLGSFWLRDDNCFTGDDDKRQDVHVIYARPGRTPRFFARTYRSACGNHPRWTPRGALKPVTPITPER